MALVVIHMSSSRSNRRPLALVPSFTAAAITAGLTIATFAGRSSTAARDAGPVMRSDAVARVARDRARSVVLLHIVIGEAGTPGRTWFLEPVREAVGSGVVIDDRGLVLTNAHVIESAGQIHVRRPDGEDLDTTVVGTDPDSDVALVRVSDAAGLAPAPLGDSDQIDVGSFVVAIGSPLGLHHTVTSGVLSAKARGLDDSGMEFLQTDAAVNPGSSGAPLFDLSGRVIGLITGHLTAGGDTAGLNFAIPINAVKELLPALRENRVSHGWLGIVTLGLTGTGAKAFGLAHPADGMFIRSVEPESPAAHAGVLPSDVLLGLAGSAPIGATEAYRHVRNLPPGTRVILRVLRDGAQIEIPVVLGVQPRT